VWDAGAHAFRWTQGDFAVGIARPRALALRPQFI
jgi:hypothetical protein